MRASEFLQAVSKYLYVGVLVALLPAVISLALAVWSAATGGHVTVVALGRTATSHAIVPWLQGWARFTSPLVLLAALYAYYSSHQPSQLRLLAFVVLAVTGLGMLCYSQWFTSLSHALFFFGFVGYVLLAYLVQATLGRIAVLGLLFATVFGFLYVYAAA